MHYKRYVDKDGLPITGIIIIRDGNQSFIFESVNGRFHGFIMVYEDSLRKKQIVNIDKYNERAMFFLPSGELVGLYSNINGRMHGLYPFYYPNGKTAFYDVWDNGINLYKCRDRNCEVKYDD